MEKWTLDDMRPMNGKIALITGGSDGIGYEAALELGRQGARIIIASDDPDKGIAAVKHIADEVTNVDVAYEALDLSDLQSVRLFANRMRRELPSLDVLILNGGISGVPKRHLSPDGFELMLATNYLGHFALSAQLFPLLSEVPDARIIPVSSLEHRHAQIHFDDLQLTKDYSRMKAYGQSKLALLMFGLELHRRARERGLFVKSIPVHPGAASTDIFERGAEQTGHRFHPASWLSSFTLKTLGQSAKKGAIPLLFAANSREAKSGGYYGPGGVGELWGNHPEEAKMAVQAQNRTAAQRLWRLSEELTGVSFQFEGWGLSQHH